jgi:hypothetical protein
MSAAALAQETSLQEISDSIVPLNKEIVMQTQQLATLSLDCASTVEAEDGLRASIAGLTEQQAKL